jgi:hypothetical protein
MPRRFLPDKRAPIGDYDRIRFDEAEIQALRGRLDLDTPLRVHWTWDYATEIESLRALYERGKTGQWNVETAIDWTIVVSDDEFLLPVEQCALASLLRQMGTDEATVKRAVHEELEWSLSQLLHGEQAAMQLCAQLVNAVPDMDTKLFAGQQVVDECRHVEIFAKLLARKFGTVHPVSANVKFLLDEMLSTSSWYKKVVGMQVLFEGVAMAVITDLGVRTRNELIRQAMRNVARDEARHAAFGVLALRELIGQLPAAEREELEDWTWMCLEVVANGLMQGLIDDVAPRYGLAPEPVANMIFRTEAFWDARYHLFNHTVLPNLRKLGLISDRTRANYDAFRLWEAQAPFGTPRANAPDFLAEN